jgi:hypothetical protein
LLFGTFLHVEQTEPHLGMIFSKLFLGYTQESGGDVCEIVRSVSVSFSVPCVIFDFKAFQSARGNGAGSCADLKYT